MNLKGSGEANRRLLIILISLAHRNTNLWRPLPLAALLPTGQPFFMYSSSVGLGLFPRARTLRQQNFIRPWISSGGVVLRRREVEVEVEGEALGDGCARFARRNRPLPETKQGGFQLGEGNIRSTDWNSSITDMLKRKHR